MEFIRIGYKCAQSVHEQVPEKGLRAEVCGSCRTARRKKAATPAAAAPVSAKAKQQDKMKSCNADAKTKALKGDERKKFMSSCLKA